MHFYIFVLFLVGSTLTSYAPVYPFESLMDDNREGQVLFEEQKINSEILGEYSLHSSILSGNKEKFEALCSFDSANEESPQGLTPLLMALQVEDVSLCLYYIKRLLDNGANPFVAFSEASFVDKSFHYKNPTKEFINFMKSTFQMHWISDQHILYSAIEADNDMLILQCVKEIDFEIDSYFIEVYCDTFHLHDVNEYLNTKYDQAVIENTLDDLIEGLTLHSSIRKGNELATKIFVKIKRVDINSLNDMGVTPLHLSVYYDTMKTMILLIDNGCLLNERNDYGQTALLVAIEMVRKEHVKYLLNKGADVEIPDWNDKNALTIALRRGDCELSTLLLDYYRTNFSNDQIDEVTFSGCFGRKKIRSIKRIDSKDSSGRTALHSAILSSKFELALVLLDYGCSVDVVEEIYKWTPLHCAATYGNAKVIETLIKKGCKLWERDFHGRTPLNIACKEGRIDECRLIIESYSMSYQKKSSNFLSKNPFEIPSTKSNFTPLHSAVVKGNLEIVKLLLAKGCDPCKKIKTGETALDLADEKEMISSLQAHFK